MALAGRWNAGEKPYAHNGVRACKRKNGSGKNADFLAATEDKKDGPERNGMQVCN